MVGKFLMINFESSTSSAVGIVYSVPFFSCEETAEIISLQNSSLVQKLQDFKNSGSKL